MQTNISRPRGSGTFRSQEQVFQKSPRRHLPIEILQEIFERCLPLVQFISPSSLEAPLLLCQVCSSWRNIAISHCALWSSLSIPSNMDIMLLWFERAGTAAMNIAINSWILSDNPVISVILNHLSSSFKHVRIRLADQESVLWHDHIQSIDLSALERLELAAENPWTSLDLSSFNTALKTATRLKRLAWFTHGSFPIHDVVWCNITWLSIHANLTARDCVHIFNALNGSALEHFVLFHIPTLGSVSTALIPNITFPRLRLFSISISHYSHIILDAITLPALREIGIAGDDWNEAEWTPFPSAFCNMLARSQCELISLNLYLWCVSSDAIFSCLSACHSTLKELTLFVNWAGTDELYDRMTVGASGQCLCPRLDVLALYGNINQVDTISLPGVLTKMVQSRLVDSVLDTRDPLYVSRLRVLELTNGDPEAEYLRPLREEGLLLRTYTHDKFHAEVDEEDERKFQQLREDGMSWFAYPATIYDRNSFDIPY